MFWPPQSAADAAAIGEAKQTLRRAVLQRRGVRPDADRSADDAARFEQVRAFIGGSTDVHTVGCYLSVPPEPATLQLIAWLASASVRVLLPVITEPTEAGGSRSGGPFGEPDWAAYAGPDRLRQGRLGLIEPDTEPLGADALAEAQLIIVPGLAGNTAGARLGRGGGWYDRALTHAARTAVTLLLLNDDEVVDVIPTHPWDHTVDVIATPTRLINCRVG